MSKTTRAFIFFILVMSVPTLGQELKSEVLERLKRATVFVTVRTEDRHYAQESSASGFLFLRKQSVGYIISCEHAVGSADSVEVVFNSGQTDEKAFSAAIVATDSDRDLACLKIKDVKDLPFALDVGEQTVVKETEVAYVAGFPFGKYIAAGERNPEISVTKVSVSSIRRNDAGSVASVQVSGDVNPGNSGGPVVDARGKVIGVVRAGIRGSGMSFAIPPEEIREFLKGRVNKSTAKVRGRVYTFHFILDKWPQGKSTGSRLHFSLYS